MRVIDNKLIDMTNDEWNTYEKIVNSYTTPTCHGKEYFVDLFEVDDNGIIIYLNPPSQRQTSFEIFLFMMSVMMQQHLRVMHGKIDFYCSKLNEKTRQIEEFLNKNDIK
jgi:hypothetical protein